MKIREYLAQASRQLPACRITAPNLEIEVLMRHVLGIERAEFFTRLEHDLTPSQESQLDGLLQRRVQGEPLAYITGHREFYGLDFFVNDHVLIPRQETELLVDKTLESARTRPSDSIAIADVGTGSGAIAIAIASNLPDATLYATDLDAKALAVADINRRNHRVSKRVHLVLGNLLEALDCPLDVIVSNPPYVSTCALARLAPEVGREPGHALDGGPDGLDIIRRLLQQAPAKLRPGGCVFLEISPEQLEAVMGLARDAFPCSEVTFARDLLDLPRVVCVRT